MCALENYEWKLKENHRRQNAHICFSFFQQVGRENFFASINKIRNKGNNGGWGGLHMLIYMVKLL